jgi:Disulphide bond corrector protein DsbC
MKKIILICLTLLSFGAFAQNANIPEKPVKWTANIENVEGEPHLFIRAKTEKGWHFFSDTPGGDGMAIPTEIVVAFKQGETDMELPIHDAQANNPPTKHKMEGMGEVSYYEGDVVYSFPIATLNTRIFTIRVGYQCCNDKLCLPPANEEIEVKGE